VNSASQQVIDGPYLRDILDQPAALKDTLEGFRRNDALFSQIGEMRRKGHSRIVLTGMGSSLHALYPLELKLIAQGEIAMRADMSELIYSMPTLLESGALIVAVSQSGRSAEVVRLLEMRAQRWTVVGVTNTADSPLGSQADIVLLTHCGSEFSVSAKTYLGTLAALEIFGAAWCGEDREALYAELQPGPSLVADYLSGWQSHVESLAGAMRDISQTFIVGRGRSMAACETGALITKESTRSPAEAMSSAAFRHGPLELAGPETMVLVMEGDANARALKTKLVRDIHDRGGRAELIGPSAEIGALRVLGGLNRLLPIAEILPIQMLTLALALNAGFEPGRFLHATKVTTEE
jgi:glucosamine--fructose-6-phosphate aminotransferase (isomerizing)